jgi:hypothetical protein
MSTQIWLFLALLAMGLMSVGGVSVTHAQEFHDCPMPQTHLRLVPETEEYRDSSHQFQECQVPETEESLTTETEEHDNDLQLPIYCLMPQTEQYLEPGVPENDGKDWRSRYFVDPCAVCDVTTDGPGSLCGRNCLAEDYVIRDYLGDQFIARPLPYVENGCCPKDIFIGPYGYTHCDPAK